MCCEYAAENVWTLKLGDQSSAGEQLPMIHWEQLTALLRLPPFAVGIDRNSPATSQKNTEKGEAHTLLVPTICPSYFQHFEKKNIRSAARVKSYR